MRPEVDEVQYPKIRRQVGRIYRDGVREALHEMSRAIQKYTDVVTRELEG